MMFLAVTCMIGILIGLHHNVVAVVPATLAAVLASCIAAAANGEALLAIVATALLSTIGLQGGYMIGLTARGMLGRLIARFSTPQSKRI